MKKKSEKSPWVLRKCTKVRKSCPKFQNLSYIQAIDALKEQAQGAIQQKYGKTCEIHKFQTFHHIQREDKFKSSCEGEREVLYMPLFSPQDFKM